LERPELGLYREELGLYREELGLYREELVCVVYVIIVGLSLKTDR